MKLITVIIRSLIVGFRNGELNRFHKNLNAMRFCTKLCVAKKTFKS